MVQTFEFQYFGGVFRKEYFLGYDEIVDIFWGHHNWAFFLDGGKGSFILYIYFLGLFLKVKVQNWNIFWGVLYVKYFWGMPDVPVIFLGVNSR